jgi:hypothetical protein
MTKLTVLLNGLLLTVSFSAVGAQVPPPGAGDKSLEDRSIKNRSIELERIKRDAEKPDNNSQAAMPPAKFQEIKDDFETIQRMQDEIVTIYTRTKQINYARISNDAEQMNKSATRLASNLFPVIENQKSGKKSKDQKQQPGSPLPEDLKSMIVEQDNTLAAFVANPMFTNPTVVNAADNARARSDLERLIKLSAALKLEAEKAKK